MASDRDSHTPSAIRERCRALFLDHLGEAMAVFGDPQASHRDKREALRLLGDFGLGKADQAAVHVHAEGDALLGVVMLPALGTGRSAEAAANERRQAPAALPKPDVPPAKSKSDKDLAG